MLRKIYDNQFADVIAVESVMSPVGAHVADGSLSAAKPLSPPAGAIKLLIQALNQNVRFTLDGTTPTASTGFQMKAGNDPLAIVLAPNVVVTVIEETSGAEIQYQWGF